MTKNANVTESLTENPEDEADLNFRDEFVDGPERLFEQRFNLVSSHVLVGVERRGEYLAGRRPVGGHGARLTLEAERGQSEQD